MEAIKKLYDLFMEVATKVPNKKLVFSLPGNTVVMVYSKDNSWVDASVNNVAVKNAAKETEEDYIKYLTKRLSDLGAVTGRVTAGSGRYGMGHSLRLWFDVSTNDETWTPLANIGMGEYRGCCGSVTLSPVQFSGLMTHTKFFDKSQADIFANNALGMMIELCRIAKYTEVNFILSKQENALVYENAKPENFAKVIKSFKNKRNNHDLVMYSADL